MVRSFRGEQRFIRLHVALHGFTYVHHTAYLALTRLVVIRRIVFSRFRSRLANANLRYIVRAATLFRLLGSSGDTDGSLVKR